MTKSTHVTPPPDASHAPASAHAPGALPAPRRGRVLVVDDEPGLLRAAERILAGEHSVATALLPSAALELFARFDPDLVICDVRMPEMDGFALVERLRRISDGFDVIFMTGASAEPDATLVKAIRQEAFFFVQKPFDRQVLLTLVDRCLERRRLRDAERSHSIRMQRELEEARVVQRALLPAPDARLGSISVAARLLSSQELGGDLYDYFGIPGGLAFLLADVCGHGASAALITTVVKTSFRSSAADGFDPCAVMDRLGEGMRHFGHRTFVTAVCGRIAGGALEYVNAGHPDAALHVGGTTRLLESTAPVVSAAFRAGAWPGERVPWEPGARLAICSDGFAEVPPRPMRALLEELRAEVASARSPAEIADSMIARVERALAGAPAPDDVTIFVAAQES